METKEWGECGGRCQGCKNCNYYDDDFSLVGCMTKGGVSCVFPFNWKGKQYYECTVVDDTAKWCATSGAKVDRMYYGRGYCSEEC